VNQDVADAIEALKRAFPDADVTVEDDRQGGARVIVERVELCEKFIPRHTWMGGHLTAHYPHSDIYPVFIAADVRRADGRLFEVPVTYNANFMGRPALQVSRMNNQLHAARQTAVAKFIKILHFLENLR
jgi:hypothetical protein